MPGTMLKNLSLFCLIAIATLVAEHVFFAVSDVAAQAKPQYLVVPVQIPFGDRGARQYEALLQQLSAARWDYDHDLPGFVIFKRQPFRGGMKLSNRLPFRLAVEFDGVFQQIEGTNRLTSTRGFDRLIRSALAITAPVGDDFAVLR